MSPAQKVPHFKKFFNQGFLIFSSLIYYSSKSIFNYTALK